MRLKVAVVAGALLVSGACSVKKGGPPAIEVDRTACSRCGMLISEPLYAAAFQGRDGIAQVFDDIACLRDAAQGRPPGLRFWFHDADDRAWIDGAGAAFVTAPGIRAPMGGHLIAFRDPAAAERAALKHHGRIVRSISSLLTVEGGS
jgi:copper chaperone NosL